MAAPKWVTLRAQWLGQQLRDLREANGILLKDTAEYLQRDPSTAVASSPASIRFAGPTYWRCLISTVSPTAIVAKA